ncbi:dermonecrotic toxin LcsSicTox-betaIC1-like [Panonychus citri]|uniref:dermonecrotic toxin LcsSicTox-betaIC1-like n=1 Tax=Panonychus citri TaxID=50023 RepID=UPI0023074F7B|nr:dermonecrotic toxin LcsSicTox-betaIC1-like [Panonychus citri]
MILKLHRRNKCSSQSESSPLSPLPSSPSPSSYYCPSSSSSCLFTNFKMPSIFSYYFNYLIISSLIILFSSLVHGADSSARPFYNIAHMVNSIKEINTYLSRGANAIEADVSFSLSGSALYTFHGYPCDCFRHCTEREDIETYLAHVREITKPENANYKKDFALLFLDLKISTLPASVKANAGSDLAQKVIANLFEFGSTTSKIKLLLSIGHVYDYDFVLGFQNELESNGLEHLNKKIGWDVGMNDRVEDVIGMWQRLEITNNIWLGDGFSNCISPFYNLGRLTQVITKRDTRSGMIPDPVIDKVYHWTIDLHHNLRASLKFGVDGIITNHPERLFKVLKEPSFRFRYRLATTEDDPWERIQSDPEEKPAPSANVMPPVSLRVVTSAADMFTSFTKYLRDFVFLRLPVYDDDFSI